MSLKAFDSVGLFSKKKKKDYDYIVWKNVWQEHIYLPYTQHLLIPFYYTGPKTWIVLNDIDAVLEALVEKKADFAGRAKFETGKNRIHHLS